MRCFPKKDTQHRPAREAKAASARQRPLAQAESAHSGAGGCIPPQKGTKKPTSSGAENDVGKRNKQTAKKGAEQNAKTEAQPVIGRNRRRRGKQGRRQVRGWLWLAFPNHEYTLPQVRPVVNRFLQNISYFFHGVSAGSGLRRIGAGRFRPAHRRMAAAPAYGASG